MAFPTTLSNAQNRNAVAGTCNTNGTAVTRVVGDNFTSIICGFIEIGGSIDQPGVLYPISSITDADHLILSISAGVQTGKYFTAALEIKALHLNALEAKVGIDNSADPSSLDKKVATLEGAVQFATAAEAKAGVVTNKIIVPSQLRYGGGLRCIGMQNVVAATTVTFPSLVPGINYKLKAQLYREVGTNPLGVRFNEDSAAHYEYNNLAYNSSIVPTQDYGVAVIVIPIEYEPNYPTYSRIELDFITLEGNSKSVVITGRTLYGKYSNNRLITCLIDGLWYSGVADLLSITVIATGGGVTFTGKLYLYEYEQAVAA